MARISSSLPQQVSTSLRSILQTIIILIIITLLLLTSSSLFVSAQNLAVEATAQSTVFSDITRTASTTIQGTVCEYCSVQIGPNFRIGSSPSPAIKLTIDLTVSKGANITFVDFRMENDGSSSFTNSNQGILVSLTMASASVCGASFTWNGNNLKADHERDKIKLSFVNSTIHATDATEARGIVIDKLQLDSSPCPGTQAGIQTSLPHFKMSLQNTTVTATCTGSCTDDAIAIINSVNTRIFTGRWRTLMELDVRDSYLEGNLGTGVTRPPVSPSTTTGYATWAVYFSGIGFASMLLKNSQLRSLCSNGGRHFSGVFVISDTNEKFSSSAQEMQTTFEKYYKYEVDIVTSGCLFEIRADFGSQRAIQIVGVNYFSRLWVLNAKILHSARDSTSGTNGRSPIYMIDIDRVYYESNKTKEQLGWYDDDEYKEYFRMVPDRINTIFNSTTNASEEVVVSWKPEVDLCGVLLYNIDLDQNLTMQNFGWQIVVDEARWMRNFTISNFTTYVFEGNSTVSTVMFQNMYRLEHVLVQHVFATYHNVYENALLRGEKNYFGAKTLTLNNVTMLRKGPVAQKANTGVWTSQFGNDEFGKTVMVARDIRCMREDGLPDVAISTTMFGLVGIKSLYINGAYANGYGTDPSAGLFLAGRDDDPFTGELIVENSTFEGTGTNIAVGVGIVGGYKPTLPGEVGLEVPRGLPIAGLPNTQFSTIILRNVTIDLRKYLPEGKTSFKQCAFGAAGSDVGTYTISGSRVTEGTNAFCVLPFFSASINNFIAAHPCSFFGNAGEFVNGADASLQFTEYRPAPTRYIIERCTETKSFKFPEPTESESVTVPLTSTVTMLQTPSNTKPRTLSPTFHPPPVSSALADNVKAALGSVSSLAAVGAIAGGAPGVALDANRAMSSLITLSRCRSYQEAQNLATTKTPDEVRLEFIDDYINRPLTFPESPIPFLCMGSERGSCIRGAVFSNWLILFLAIIFATLFGLFKYREIHKTTKSSLRKEYEDEFNKRRTGSVDDHDHFGDNDDEEELLNFDANNNNNNNSGNSPRSPPNADPLLLKSPLSTTLKRTSSTLSTKNNINRNNNNNSQSLTTILSSSSESSHGKNKNNHNSTTKGRTGAAGAPKETANKKFNIVAHQRAKRLEREMSSSNLESRKKEQEAREKQLKLDQTLLVQQQQLPFYSFSRYPMFLGQCSAILLSPWSQMAASLIAAPDLPSGDMFVWGIGSMIIWFVLGGIFVKTVYAHLPGLDTSNLKKNNNRKDKHNTSNRNNTNNRRRSDMNNTSNNNVENNNNDVNFTSFKQLQDHSPWRLEKSFLHFGDEKMSKWRNQAGVLLRSSIGRWLFIGDLVWAEGEKNGGKANGRIGSMLWQMGSIMNKSRGAFEVEVPLEDRSVPKGKKSISQSQRDSFESKLPTRVYQYNDVLTRISPYFFAINCFLCAFVGFITGISAVHPESCDGVIVSQTTTSAISLTITILLRPYLVQSRNFLSIVADALLFIGCVVAKTSDYDSDVGPAIVIAAMVVSVLSGVVSGGKHIMLLICGGTLQLRSELWRKVSASLDKLFKGLTLIGAEGGQGLDFMV